VKVRAAGSRHKYLQREALSLIGYLALALCWTWPLALRFGTHIAGGNGPLAIGDNLEFAWSFDHVARSWAQGRSALQDANLFFPHPVSLALHTMQWHHCLLAALAWRIFPSLSLASVCNSLLIGTLCLNASATRALCRHVISRAKLSGELSKEGAAWLVGAGAALGPISQARSLGHWNLLAWGYLPLLMLALLRLDELVAVGNPASTCGLARRAAWLERARRAAAASLCLALAGWCDVQFVLFAGLWAVAFSVASRHPRRLERAAWWAASFGGGALLLGPLLAVMLGASSTATRMTIAPQWSMDVVDLLSPSPWHPIMGRFAFCQVPTDGIEWVVAPGLTLLALGIYGWRRAPQAARPWAWGALMLCLLACGPRLQLAHHPIHALHLPGLSKPPKMSKPPSTLRPASPEPSSAASRWDAWQDAVRLPFWWLRQSVGPLKSFRAPARLSIAALACWSVCAALGLSALSGLKPQVLAPGLSRFNMIFVLAALGIGFDCWRAPLPSFDARPPRWAMIIRDSARQFPSQAQGVVPLPLTFNDWRLSWAVWAQTIHRQPLFNAYLSRAPRLWPAPQADAVRGSALWRALSTQARSDDPDELLALGGALPAPAQAARDLEAWLGHGARFLVWQRGVARREDEARLRQVLARSGRARLLFEDESALLWEITPRPGTL